MYGISRNGCTKSSGIRNTSDAELVPTQAELSHCPGAHRWELTQRTCRCTLATRPSHSPWIVTDTEPGQRRRVLACTGRCHRQRRVLGSIVVPVRGRPRQNPINRISAMSREDEWRERGHGRRRATRTERARTKRRREQGDRPGQRRTAKRGTEPASRRRRQGRRAPAGRAAGRTYAGRGGGTAGPCPIRILFESRPQFQGLSGATNRAVTRRHRCVGFGWVRE